MKPTLITTILLLAAAVLTTTATTAAAYEAGEMFFDPHLGVGFNVAQGTYLVVGADAGYAISDQLAAGIGAYYSAGKRPEQDREIGGGPFVMFFQPLASFLVVHVREDLYYIDQNTPVLIRDDDYSDVNDTGVASITSLGLHLIITPNLGISGGYRAVLPLSNSDLGTGRSGMFLGFSIGI